MSLAGIRSNRGDTYQRAVAIHFVVEMLLGNEIEGIQVDSIAIPGEDHAIFGDDIVLLKAGGKRCYVQAKVNQTDHHPWRITDSVFKKELIAAKEQLLSDELSEFQFYSRTPFGDFQRVIEEIRLYPDYPAFQRTSANKHKRVLDQLSQLWEIDGEYAFLISRRIFIGSHHSVDEWDNYCVNLLKIQFSQPETAYELLWSYIDKQHSKLGQPQYIIDKKCVLSMLDEHKIYHSLSFDEHQLLDQFKIFSQQGRQWVRSIGSEVLSRNTLFELKAAISEKKSTVLLEDVAGGGKTCILLDLVDYLDTQKDVATLFIKGDLFSAISSLSDLADYGLPSDLIAQCARLAEHKQLVVVIDSLDVLAVGRSHQALQSFLGLIALLKGVPNICIIAACRSFDAKYDPLLRETEWSATIRVESLSFSDDVTPLIEKWGINSNSLSEELKQLLIIPQNLRLFYSLAQKGLKVEEIEGHDLYDSYIREIIEKDSVLGEKVIIPLQELAADLLKQRSYVFPKNRLTIDDIAIQRLLSHQVVTEVNASQLMFSHQTLTDALRIRLAQQNGITLVDFVNLQPQFPFVRPAVRAFIQSLRSGQVQVFIKQVLNLLRHPDIAIHIKRLAVETLAEMNPTEEDLIILMYLFRHNTSLFLRFLDRAKSISWFQFLFENWLPTINVDSSNEACNRFVFYAAQFKHQFPYKLITLWTKTIEEQWLPIHSLLWTIPSELCALDQWQLEGVEQLLISLFELSKGERDSIGKAICRYVESTNGADQLLWKYISQDAAPIKEIKRGREIKLRCQSHELSSDDFLEQRLKKSDELFGLAIEYLHQIGQKDKEYRWSILLNETSWQRRHSNRDISPHDSIHAFLNAMEAAMKMRAGTNDSCWQRYEPLIRHSKEHGIRYLLCEAYRCNIQKNIDGIIAVLMDKELLRFGKLEYEIGVLANESYPYLSMEVQDAFQQLVMTLYDDLEEESTWVDSKRFEYLCWVPAPYRLEVLDVFFEKLEKENGAFRPEPYIFSSGGWVRSPVTEDEMLVLSSVSLIRIFHHYNSYYDWHNHCNEILTGGRESVESALSSAASLVPEKFIPLISDIKQAGLSNSYIFSIISGVATHLSARFGNCQHQGWHEVEPLPEGTELASQLLSLVEQYHEFDEREYSTVRAIQSCCFVLNDQESLSRICIQLLRLSKSDNPSLKDDEAEQDLIETGINSTRGIAAECVVMLGNNLLEDGVEIPDELLQLIEVYATDPSMVVRATFLRRFPYFLSKQTELGWHLISLLSTNATSRLWKYFEQSFYYQYYENFERVNLYLDEFLKNNHDKTAEAWGRLAALSYLSGFIDEEELFSKIETGLSESTKIGVGQVFTHNISNMKSRMVCTKGLMRLLNMGSPNEVYRNFEHRLEQQDYVKFIPDALIDLFIQQASIENFRDINGLFVWMENKVVTNSERILELIEKLVDRLSTIREPLHFYRPEHLITTLKLLLQKADMMDDVGFINRILAVQDWFIGQGISDLDEMIEVL